MKPRTPLFPDAHAPHELYPAPSMTEEFDALIGLINQCVDAMNIMQDRLSGLEDNVRLNTDTLTRDQAEACTALLALQARMVATEGGMDQLTVRLSACEASAAETAEADARDMLAMRQAAEGWRERAEAEITRLEGFEHRLVAVEHGLGQRLASAEAQIQAVNAAAMELHELAEQSEGAAADSARKLQDAGAAIAEQRSRIAALQAKLAAATGLRRPADPATGAAPFPGATDIIDLAELPAGQRVSAA